MKDRDGQLGHPIQRKDYDLSKNARDNDNPPTLTNEPNEYRSPAVMMRQMGFDPSKNMTPLQFLVAVMNDDLDAIFKNEKRRARYESKGGLAMNYRIEAAKTAAKYMHMQMPTVTISEGNEGKFGEGLARGIAAGNERVTTKRIILETVERISPNVPLAPASYPPAFQEAVESEYEEIGAEGDTDYDPDNDAE